MIIDTGAWKDVASTCGGLNQSPVNLDKKQSTLKGYEKFKFYNYGNLDRMVLSNNGHTGNRGRPKNEYV